VVETTRPPPPPEKTNPPPKKPRKSSHETEKSGRNRFDVPLKPDSKRNQVGNPKKKSKGQKGEGEAGEKGRTGIGSHVLEKGPQSSDFGRLGKEGKEKRKGFGGREEKIKKGKFGQSRE